MELQELFLFSLDTSIWFQLASKRNYTCKTLRKVHNLIAYFATLPSKKLPTEYVTVIMITKHYYKFSNKTKFNFTFTDGGKLAFD